MGNIQLLVLPGCSCKKFVLFILVACIAQSWVFLFMYSVRWWIILPLIIVPIVALIVWFRRMGRGDEEIISSSVDPTALKIDF